MHGKDEVKSSCISVNFWIWGENKKGSIVNFDHMLSPSDTFKTIKETEVLIHKLNQCH